MDLKYLDGLNLPTLSGGSHDEGSEDLCIMEAIAFIEREPHSDTPKCTAPEVAHFCQGLNDAMPQEYRDKLWFYAERIAGTASPEHTQERLDYLAQAACNKFAAMACEGIIPPHFVTALRLAQTNDEIQTAIAAALDAAGVADLVSDRVARAARDAVRAVALAAARAASRDARAASCAAARAALSAAARASFCDIASIGTARAAARAAAALSVAAAWDVALEVLDGLLEIGCVPKVFDAKRVEELIHES